MDECIPNYKQREVNSFFKLVEITLVYTLNKDKIDGV